MSSTPATQRSEPGFYPLGSNGPEGRPSRFGNSEPDEILSELLSSCTSKLRAEWRAWFAVGRMLFFAGTCWAFTIVSALLLEIVIGHSGSVTVPAGTTASALGWLVGSLIGLLPGTYSFLLPLFRSLVSLPFGHRSDRAQRLSSVITLYPWMILPMLMLWIMYYMFLVLKPIDIQELSTSSMVGWLVGGLVGLLPGILVFSFLSQRRSIQLRIITETEQIRYLARVALQRLEHVLTGTDNEIFNRRLLVNLAFREAMALVAQAEQLVGELKHSKDDEPISNLSPDSPRS